MDNGRQIEIEQSIKLLNDKYFRQIQRILNKNSYLFTSFTESTPKEDKEEGFDSVFTVNQIKIPIRIRQYYYYKRFRDITIRSKSYHDKETEIHKLKKGFGDYYFYAWENEAGCNIIAYTIFDIKKFVKSGLIDNECSENRNNDGTMFKSYSLEKLIKNDVLIFYEKLKH